MPLVTLAGVGKSYGTRTVLRQVHLSVRRSERIGVVGRNGSGKSTLARILCGAETPDVGEILRGRGARVGYLEQVPKFEDDLSAEQAVLRGLEVWTEAARRHRAASEALAAGAAPAQSLLEQQARAAEDLERLGGWDQRHRVTSILGQLGIDDAHVAVSRLSGGEQRRVALARILIERPDLAVFDEPTNHLDADTIEWFERYLTEQFPGAVLLITHDRYLLDRIVTRTVEISDAETYLYDGGFELYLEQKAERLAHAARVEQNRQNFLRRELEWLRRQPKARTTKQAARVERAQAALCQPRPKVEREVELALNVSRSGKTVLELSGIELAMGGRTLVRGLDLCLTAGERIGIVGRNGTGKTTLLRAIHGDHCPQTGKVARGANTQILYFDQVRSTLDDHRTVFENAVGSRTQIQAGGHSIEPITYLERFGFDRHQQRQPVGSLSGGERARVALAALLCQPGNLILLDEPTNDLDIETLGVLETALVEQNATVLVVTHDRWFLDRVATAILAFEAHQRAVLYPGNYQTFQRLRAQGQREQTSASSQKDRRRTAPSSQRPSTKGKKLTFKQERELEALPETIEQAERHVTQLEAQLSDPATYAGGGGQIGALTRELESARQAVDDLMQRWEELERIKAGETRASD